MPSPNAFKQILAADPNNTSMVASNGSILLFAPGDSSKTPIVLWDLSHTIQIANPVKVNALGFGPAFLHDTLYQVAWEGGGFTGTFESFAGMRDDTEQAKNAAQSSASSAELAAANAATGAAGALAATVAEAEAAKIAAQQAAALVGAPADMSTAALVGNPATLTGAALKATFALKGEVGGGGISLDTDGVPYFNPSGAISVAIDTDGVPYINA